MLALPDADGRVDLAALMRELGARGINELHVEAGGKLNGALLAAGLVDEVLLYLAPCLLGDPARGHRGVARRARPPRRPRRARDLTTSRASATTLRVRARASRAEDGGLMFTGIVQAMGRIAAVEPKGDGLRIAVDIGLRDVADVAVGDSIAINGCCLTIVEVERLDAGVRRVGGNARLHDRASIAWAT